MGKRPNIHAADWYVRHRGSTTKIGPFSLATLTRMWRQGNIVHHDLLYAKGVLPRWVRAGRLEYLFVEDEQPKVVTSQVSDSPISTALPSDTSAPNQDRTSDKQRDGLYFIKEAEQLRGPISRKQLEILSNWGEVQPQTLLYDEAGKLVATIEKVLDLPETKQHLGQPEISNSVKKIRSHQGRRKDLIKAKPAVSRAQKKKRSHISKENAKQGKPAAPASHEKSHSLKSFSELLSDAVAYEKSAHAEQEQVSSSNSMRPPTRKERKRVKKKKLTADSNENLPVTKSSSEIRKPMRRLQKSLVYSQVCTVWSLIYLILSVIVLTGANALFCLFLKRVGALCLSTYIPFGTTPEELQQEALLIAGISTVLTGLFLLYHLWYLLRTDCIPWHALVTLAFGFVLGLWMPAEMYSKMFQIVQFGAALCGLALMLTSLRLFKEMKGPHLLRSFAVTWCCTLIGTGGLFVSLAQPLYEIKINELPPVLSGTGPVTMIFVVSVALITLSFPGFCFLVMSKEASRPVREFWDGHILCAVISCCVIVATSYWMSAPQQSEFISIPFTLLPLAALSTIVAFIPPVLWLSTPYNLGLN